MNNECSTRQPLFLLGLFVACASLLAQNAPAATAAGSDLRTGLWHHFPAVAELMADYPAGDENRSDLPLAYRSGHTEYRGTLMRHSTQEARASSLRLQSEGDSGQEVLVLASAPEGGGVAYELEAPGIEVAVPSGRGMRLLPELPGTDEGYAFGAPLIVDADGRPSTAARWETAKRQDRGRSALRLRIDDPRLRYPAVVIYAFGKPSSVDALSAGMLTNVANRRLKPIANATGAISGRVTDAATGAELPFEMVEIWNSLGAFVTFGATDANGNYMSEDGLGTGSYRVTAWAFGYEREVYNNIPCPFDCDVAVGTAVNVTDGATTANINFALTRQVTELRGAVTNRVTGASLSGVGVGVYNSAGTFVTFVYSDESGSWEATLSSGGTFFVRSHNGVHAGYVDVLYSGMDCTACNVTAGTAIAATSGSTISNVNLALNPNGGRVAGRVTSSSTGAGIPFAIIQVFNSAGQLVSFATADNGGNYVSFLGVVSGSYYVKAFAPNYDAELYNNVACSATCTPTTGNAVPVTIGATTSNINFALDRNDTTLSGLITDEQSGSPLASVAVVVHDQTGAAVRSSFSAADGTYGVNLPGGGTYFARTLNLAHHGYIDEVYNNIECSRCDVTTGTAIVVTPGVPVTNINFALGTEGGSITGLVSDSSNAPVQFALVEVYSSRGEFVTFGVTGADGRYSLLSDLSAGTYFALASKTGFGTQLYNRIACGGCNPTAGTPITVVGGQETSNINFTLGTSLARVSGHVRTASGGTPLAGIQVAFYDASGDPAGTATSQPGTGAYEVALTASGTYYARTFAPNTQYSDQLYQNISCSPSCVPTNGTAISATLGSLVADIDFALTSSACGTIIVQPATLPGGTTGSPYSATITASGGTSPVTFTVGTGEIPPGIELDSESGALFGTPTDAGNYSFDIIVIDANGCVGSRAYTISITSSGTGTTLSASTTSAVYGTAVILTAVVTPTDATGTVTFRNGLTVVGSASLSSGTASLTLPSLNAGSFDFTARYEGDLTHDPSTSNLVHVDILKATPTITWNDPAAIIYGTPISAAQLNATASVAGTFNYSVAAGTILDAGTHVLSVVFIPTDATNYTDAAKSVNLVVQKADQSIQWPTPADITYGTPPGPMQLNATVTVPGPSAAGALTYTPPAGTVLPAGTHVLTVAAAGTQNYNAASAQVNITILKATPVFSDLTSPTVVFGAPALIGGKISLGSLVPTGDVTITINGASQTAAIQADGSFAATFPTTGLPPMTSGYAIAFAYGGDANFNSTAGSATLDIQYATQGRLVSNGPVPSNGTASFRVKVLDAAGNNLSSRALIVTAYGIRKAAGGPWILSEGSGLGDTEFRFQGADGGSYFYGQKLNRLEPGNYVFGFTVGADATIHTVAFSVK